MSTIALRSNLYHLISQLPPENVRSAHDYLQFLLSIGKTDELVEQPPHKLKIVHVPEEAIDRMLALDIGYEGNALEDSEALYDEA